GSPQSQQGRSMKYLLSGDRRRLFNCFLFVTLLSCDESTKSSSDSDSPQPLPAAPGASRPPKAEPTEAQLSPHHAPLGDNLEPVALCPEGMAKIPAGEFWVGTLRE